MNGGGIVERIREGCRELEAQGVVPHLGYEAAAEIERQAAEIASLRLTLGGRTFLAAVPEPIGCPAPGACAQVAEITRLQAALDDIRTTFGDGAGEHARARAAAALGTPLHAAQALPATQAAPSAPERAGGLSGRPCVCCPDAYACAQAGCQLERRPSPEGAP